MADEKDKDLLLELFGHLGKLKEADALLALLAHLGRLEAALLELLKRLFTNDVTEAIFHSPGPDQCYQYSIGTNKLVGFVIQTPVVSGATYFLRFSKKQSGSYVPVTGSTPPPQLSLTGYEGTQFFTQHSVPFAASDVEYLVKFFQRTSGGVETELTNRTFRLKSSCP